MASPASSAETVAKMRGFLAGKGTPAFVIADSPGFAAPRIVVSIINLACELAQQGIASPSDIDAAARLGLGYPMGPFEWGNKLGSAQVLEILNALHKTFGDQRYRPSPWLARRSQLSLPLDAPDIAN